MGLKKAIKHGKEHRKPYYDSRRFDFSCRSHGNCSWCNRSRLRYQRLFDIVSQEQIDRLFCFWEIDENWWIKKEDDGKADN